MMTAQGGGVVAAAAAAAAANGQNHQQTHPGHMGQQSNRGLNMMSHLQQAQLNNPAMNTNTNSIQMMRPNTTVNDIFERANRGLIAPEVSAQVTSSSRDRGIDPALILYLYRRTQSSSMRLLIIEATSKARRWRTFSRAPSPVRPRDHLKCSSVLVILLSIFEVLPGIRIPPYSHRN
jgi:hypothetical protein